MSIINKMHQELQESRDDSPILSSMPKKKRQQKVLLFALITLLLASSIGLSYLIYNDKNKVRSISELAEPQVISVSVPLAVTEVETTIAPSITPTPIIATVPASPAPVKKVPFIPRNEVVAEAQTLPPAVEIAKMKPVATPLKKKTENKKVGVKQIKASEELKKPFLQVKTSSLTTMQRAQIHLNRAEKASRKGDTLLASQEKRKALNIKPDLHEVRKSLALYYYGVGEQNRATNVLKKGALKFPEYSDFNLMLSRIALKQGDNQKAYLYLNQSPPAVKGHLDYHVSYAILSQKFKNYALSEKLYQGLLTERPNNGRWIMSLAIAQDKQGKESLAVESYQRALLQIDLSSKAKKYINQRLTYLANQ